MRVTENGVWDSRLAQYELENSLRIGQRENAISILEKMIARSPDDYDAKLSLAFLQVYDENFEEAEKSIREVLAARPDSVAATAALAELYVKQGKPDEALTLCDSFLSKHDTLAAYTMRCQILLNRGDMSGVAEAIRQIEAKFGDDQDAMLIVSRLYQSIGQSEKSAEILDGLADAIRGMILPFKNRPRFCFLVRTMPLDTIREKSFWGGHFSKVRTMCLCALKKRCC